MAVEEQNAQTCICMNECTMKIEFQIKHIFELMGWGEYFAVNLYSHTSGTQLKKENKNINNTLSASIY